MRRPLGNFSPPFLVRGNHASFRVQSDRILSPPSSPFRGIRGEKEGKERKEGRKEESRIEECYVNEEVRRKSSSLINYSSTFRAGHARYPPKNVLSLPDQTRLGKVNYKVVVPVVASTRFQRVFCTPDNLLPLFPRETRVDLCVCSRKIKLSHYRAPPTRTDRSLFWRQEVSAFRFSGIRRACISNARTSISNSFVLVEIVIKRGITRNNRIRKFERNLRKRI